MENVIQVDNLVKKYKKAKEAAVNDISFNVHSGEFLHLQVQTVQERRPPYQC